MAEDRGFSNLLSTASSLLNSSQSHASNAGHGEHKPSTSAQGSNGKPSSSSHSQKPSYGEIYSSAQVVMNAAKSKLHKPSSSSSSPPSAEDVSMGKLAGAAGTLIGAVSHYGKLNESGYGKYAQKAEEYLHSYEVKHGKPGTTATAPSPPQSSPYYATSEQHGHGQDHSAYPSGPASQHSQPSAPPQEYPVGYPPTGYPPAQGSYGYGYQGYSQPSNSHTSAGNDPPLAYPPLGYPTSSGGGYNRPSK